MTKRLLRPPAFGDAKNFGRVFPKITLIGIADALARGSVMIPTLTATSEARLVSGVIGQKASLGQGKGPDVDLIVTGTGTYATYETLDGFPAIYDDFLELFCYARVVSGAYESTAVPLRSPPPPDVERHSKESDSVRALKIARRRSELDRRARPSGAKE